MPPRLSEPLSPELVLVSPPEEAQLAREGLPERPDSEWEDFLRRMRQRQLPAREEEPRVREPEPIEPEPRPAGKRIVLIAAIVAALLAGLGVAWAQQRGGGQEHPAAAQRASAPAPTTPKAKAKSKSKSNAKSRPKPAPQPRRTVTRSAPRKPKSQATKKVSSGARKSAAFVPARIWSWPAASGVKRYVVRFYRNDKKVLQVRATGPRVVLPKSFTFRPGRYRWTVYPASASGATGKPIVQSAFVVGTG